MIISIFFWIFVVRSSLLLITLKSDPDQFLRDYGCYEHISTKPKELVVLRHCFILNKEHDQMKQIVFFKVNIYQHSIFGIFRTCISRVDKPPGLVLYPSTNHPLCIETLDHFFCWEPI